MQVYVWGTNGKCRTQNPSKRIKFSRILRYKLLFSLNNGLTLLHKYTSTELWPEFTRVDPNPRGTTTWDSTSVVDNSHYPTGLSANYCLIKFTCILFLLLNICFSIYLFVFTVFFFCQHHNTNRSPNLGQTTTPSDSQQWKRTCHIVDFVVPADHCKIERKRKVW